MTTLAVVGNHLWQSSVFAAAVGLATLALRRNSASVRHALWLAASIKFLVPFGALVALGRAFGFRSAATVQREFIIVINDARHDFPLSAIDLASPASLVPPAPAWTAVIVIGAAIWLAGAVAILGVWAMRWRRVAAIARSAAPIEAGRHVDLLRRLERRAGCARPITFVSSDAPLEPGVFGIVRPVLVWPNTIGDRLDDEQAATILAHEVSHVRRRDNLAAAVHMAVEAAFWFHPLVWWIGARLVDERERACDEDVLESGSEREVYAESILTACRIYVESPLPCVAGVTGSDLTRRIERIMTSGRPRALSFWGKTVLASGAVAAVAAPIAIGAATPPARRVERMERRSAPVFALRVKRPLMLEVTPQRSTALPQFEVASVKPNRSGDAKVQIQTLPGGRFVATNVTVRFLIQYSYGLQPAQMIGGPDWLSSDRFDITARGQGDGANAFDAEKLGEPSRMQLMVRALLAERFKLGAHTESRELPIYALVLASKDGRLGPQLKPSTADCSAVDPAMFAKSGGETPPCGIRIGGGPGTMVVGGASLGQVASSLMPWVGRLVVDRTGLSGSFDLRLSWTPDQLPQGFDKKVAAGGLAAPDPNGPSIFTAVQEQLGLKLESQKAPVEVLVVDHAEHPIEN